MAHERPWADREARILCVACRHRFQHPFFLEALRRFGPELLSAISTGQSTTSVMWQGQTAPHRKHLRYERNLGLPRLAVRARRKASVALSPFMTSVQARLVVIDEACIRICVFWSPATNRDWLTRPSCRRSRKEDVTRRRPPPLRQSVWSVPLVSLRYT